MKKYLPALVCGFAAGVLNIVPFVKSFSCCLIIPFAAYYSIILYLKSELGIKRIITSKALFLGIFTGIFAAFFSTGFDTLIMYITRPDDIRMAVIEFEKLTSTMAHDSMTESMMDLMYKMSDDIQNYGFSLLYSSSVLISSLIINPIFGLIGGLFGMKVINNRMNKLNQNV